MMSSNNTSNAGPAWLQEEDRKPLRVNVPSSSGAGASASLHGAEMGASSHGLLGGATTTTQPLSPTNRGLPVSEGFVHTALRVTSMGLCVMMACTAVLGLGMISSVEESGRIFVGTYMLFFSAMLFFFELNQVRPIEYIEHLYRRNFGFLYQQLTKSLFIIFIAFLCFGLEKPETLTYMTGFCLAAFGLLGVGLYLKYPDMFEAAPQQQQQS